MSTPLIDMLKSMSEPPKKSCKLGQELERMDPETRHYVNAVLDKPHNDPRRLSHAAISIALRAEGHDIAQTTVRIHRLQECACYTTKDSA